MAMLGCSNVVRDNVSDPYGTTYVATGSSANNTSSSSSPVVGSSSLAASSGASSSALVATSSSQIVAASSSAKSSAAVISSSSLAVSSFSSTASLLLWDKTVYNYQVQVPELADGTCGGLSSCGGAWWLYDLYGGSVTPNIIAGTDTTLRMLDTSSGALLINGNLTTAGLFVHLVAPAAQNSYSPGMAGIGFYFKKDQSAIDISAHGGYVITYTTTLPVQLELGWDEATYQYDTWYATLPVSTTAKTVYAPWTLFKKDGYLNGSVIGNQPLTTAETKAVAFKIRLKNTTATADSADFVLQSLSWIQ